MGTLVGHNFTQVTDDKRRQIWEDARAQPKAYAREAHGHSLTVNVNPPMSFWGTVLMNPVYGQEKAPASTRAHQSGDNLKLAIFISLSAGMARGKNSRRMLC